MLATLVLFNFVRALNTYVIKNRSSVYFSDKYLPIRYRLLNRLRLIIYELSVESFDSTSHNNAIDV